MNGDALELANMMVEMEARLSEKIGAVHAGLAGLDGRLTTSVDAVRDSNAAFREELLGDGGRIKSIESDLRDAKFWQNVKTVIVIPVVFAIHKALTTLGIKI